MQGDSHHLELNRVRILPKPGEVRSITCTADHFHVNNSRGYLKLESCEFGFGGDDCVNIHDNNFYAVKTGPKKVLGKFYRPTHTPLHFDDVIELRNEDFSPTGYSSALKNFVPNLDEQTVELVFEEELPKNTTSTLIVFNRRYGSHHYIIRNSVFHENRAAGFRLQADHGLIEGNRFYHNQMPAIRLETGWAESLWSEGTGISNLVIRNNTFDSCNTILNEEHGPVIHSGVFRRSVASPDNKSAWPVFSSILIESNAFLNTAGAAITLSSAGGITVRSNFFSGERPRKAEMGLRSAIVVSFASNIQILDNTWLRSPFVKIPGAVLETENTGLIRFEGNTLR
ncbi:MAG: right-handed parallel beta-helix repeat-containing protein [Spirochaetia bacterium]|nr:right-handed parallel beta-helix repeat-containing protein [Spirochaetia bacterium]